MRVRKEKHVGHITWEALTHKGRQAPCTRDKEFVKQWLNERNQEKMKEGKRWKKEIEREKGRLAEQKGGNHS